MKITHRNILSIVEVAVYVPCLVTALFLSARHGFSKSAGWYFLVVFCLARIIGPAMQIATSGYPTSTALYTGYTILQSVGLSPLLLATLGFLSRLLDSINRSHTALISTRVLKFIELVLLVALILGIVGGINASEDVTKNGGVYKVPTISKVASGLFIASYAAIVVATILITFSVRRAEAGEKRILVAIAFSLPFLLVRLIYSTITTFSHSKLFSPLSGSIVILVCMALIEEFVIVAVYEGTGLTLNKISKHRVASEYIEGQSGHQTSDSAHYAPPAKKQDNVLLKIAKRSIIGRIVMSAVPSKEVYQEPDQELDQRQRFRK